MAHLDVKNGCLTVLLFLLVLPFVLMLPPVGFAILFFIAYTLYFFRKDRP